MPQQRKYAKARTHDSLLQAYNVLIWSQLSCTLSVLQASPFPYRARKVARNY